jgi:very-short-patch-repair endonuclease
MAGAKGKPTAKVVRARELRKNQSPPEAVFWSYVRNHRLHGLSFRRQHPLGPYIADFYCAEAQMVIELDGRTHGTRQAHDRARDAWMHHRGILVVRIPVPTLTKDPGVVIGRVGRIALQRIEEIRAREA